MKINYDKYRKFILLIPVILILLAVVIGVVFKFNISKEFTTTYKFTVSYNTTITESNYEKCEENIVNILNKNGGESGFSYELNKLNEEIAITTQVTLYDNELSSTQLQNQFNKISSDIEETINEFVGNGHITISELHEVAPKTISNEVINLAVVTLLGMILLFIYIWIRHEIKLAFASLFMTLYDIALMLTVFILFRIPLNQMFTVPFYFVILLSYFIFAILSDNIREGLDAEKSITNEELVNSSITKNKTVLCIIVSAFGIASLLSMLSLSLDVIFVSIACLIGIIIALYSTVFTTFAIWTKIYVKDNDKRLKAKKLKKEQPKTKKSKDQEKIVV